MSQIYKYVLKFSLNLLFLILFSNTQVGAQVININSNITVFENDGSASFLVNLSSVSANTITVNYTTVNNGATSPSDYLSNSGMLVFLPGEISKTININIINDYLYESNETFFLNINTPIGATIGQSNRSCLINNDDPLISIVNAPPVSETAGIQNFMVTISSPQAYPIFVSYATSNFTAIAGLDYISSAGTLVFAPGETTKTITIQIINDFLYDANESYNLTLSNAQEAILLLPMSFSNTTAIGSIINDDQLISISNPVTVTENNSVQIFTIALSSPVSYYVSVQYSTTNISAMSGSDYTGVTDTLIFAPGEITKTIQVNILNDYLYEGSESYSLVLSNPKNADINSPMTVNISNVMATILNDDPLITMTNPANVSESDGIQNINIQLSSAQTYSISVQYTTTNNSALSGSDYVSTSGILVFAPGETSKTVSVNIINDYLYESNEAYLFLLSNAQNADLSLPMSIGTTLITPTITNEDPYINSSVLNVTENAGVQIFNIVLSNAVSYAVSVHYATLNGSGISGSDYQSTSGDILFAPGETIKTVSINLLNDYLYEPSEFYYLVLSNAQNANLSLPMTIIGTLPTGTILNDDPTINIIAPPSVTEYGGTQTFIVKLSSPQTYTTQVSYNTVNSSAFAGTDYIGVSGALTFLPGDTIKTISVTILNDYTYESNEIYYMNLSNALNSNTSLPMSITLPGAAGGNIINDDPIIDIIQPPSVAENNGTQIFSLTLTPPQIYPVAVNYATADITAQEGLDYIPASCTITFLPGETNKYISINILDNAVIEGLENYIVQLSGAEIVGLGIPVVMQHTYANGNILDNDTINCTSAVLATPIISGVTQYCFNEMIALSIDPIPNAIGYKWTGPNGFIGSGTTIQIMNATNSMSGIYSVKAFKAGGTFCDSGNIASAVVNVSNCANTLILNAFLEGYYLTNGLMTPNLKNHGLGNNNAMTDSIIVELRDSIQTDSVVAVIKSQLNINGTTVCYFPGIIGSYYLVLKHYNTLETWSANPIILSVNPTYYSFSTSSAKAYGNNLKQVEPGVFALYSGDLNQDENIDLLDAAEIESRINNFDSCYLPSDLNGDGNTDLLDFPILESNIESFVFSLHP